MKQLHNHAILFDGECPMCQVYTKAFVATGMMEASARMAYQDGLETVCPLIDKQRAVDEIALVDLNNGEVVYGVKSIFKVFGTAFPLLAPVLNFRAFLWLMTRVYAFISYNRRVIIPAPLHSADFAYQPTFKLNYRVAYLLFTWLCTGFILTRYAQLLTPLVPLGNGYREYMICGGQIIFQGAITAILAKEKLWNYLGNMMTISFAGSLLLLVFMTINKWTALQPVYGVLFFVAIALLMFLEHLRRVKLLGLGYMLSVTWALYRAMLLVLIYVYK